MVVAIFSFYLQKYTVIPVNLLLANFIVWNEDKPRKYYYYIRNNFYLRKFVKETVTLFKYLITYFYFILHWTIKMHFCTRHYKGTGKFCSTYYQQNILSHFSWLINASIISKMLRTSFPQQHITYAYAYDKRIVIADIEISYILVLSIVIII